MSKKTVRISNLFSLSFRLIGSTKAILVPYLIYFLIQQIFWSTPVFKTYFKSPTSGLFIFVVIGWLLDLFLKLLTVQLALDAHYKSNTSFNKILGTVVQRYKPVLIAALPFTLPVLSVFYIIISGPNALQNDAPLYLWVVLSIAVLMSIISEFIPIVGLTSTFSSRRIIKATLQFLWAHLKFICLYLSVLLMIAVIILYLYALAGAIPIIGESILQVILQAFLKCCFFVTSMLLYLKLTKATSPVRLPDEQTIVDHSC